MSKMHVIARKPVLFWSTDIVCGLRLIPDPETNSRHVQSFSQVFPVYFESQVGDTAEAEANVTMSSCRVLRNLGKSRSRPIQDGVIFSSQVSDLVACGRPLWG
jgi:hypothetical protein